MVIRRKTSSEKVDTKPVGLRLTSDERTEIETIEQNHRISKAEFARQAYRRGKQFVLNELNNTKNGAA